MSIKLYEGMFLVESAKFASNPDGVTNEILGVLEKVDAEIVAHRPWHDGRLAYPIKGHRKGVHYLVMFKMESLKSQELDRVTKLNNTILRSLIINQPQVLFDAMVNALSGEFPIATDDDDESPKNYDDSDDADDSDDDSVEVPDTDEVTAE